MHEGLSRFEMNCRTANRRERPECFRAAFIGELPNLTLKRAKRFELLF